MVPCAAPSVKSALDLGPAGRHSRAVEKIIQPDTETLLQTQISVSIDDEGDVEVEYVCRLVAHVLYMSPDVARQVAQAILRQVGEEPPLKKYRFVIPLVQRDKHMWLPTRENGTIVDLGKVFEFFNQRPQYSIGLYDQGVVAAHIQLTSMCSDPVAEYVRLCTVIEEMGLALEPAASDADFVEVK